MLTSTVCGAGWSGRVSTRPTSTPCRESATDSITARRVECDPPPNRAANRPLPPAAPPLLLREDSAHGGGVGDPPDRDLVGGVAQADVLLLGAIADLRVGAAHDLLQPPVDLPR